MEHDGAIISHILGFNRRLLFNEASLSSKKPKSTKQLPKIKRFVTNFSVACEIELFRENYFAIRI